MPPRETTDADAPPGGVRVHASLPETPRRGRAATVISFLLHGLIIYIAIRLTAVVTMPEKSPIGDVIQLVLGGGGGGGGQRGSSFQHPVNPPPPPVIPPPVVTPPPPPPVPTVIPPPVQPPAAPPAVADANTAANVAAAGTGTGTGGGSGSGTGTGTGSGQGPGSGSGTGGGAGGGRGGFPPTPKTMVVPQLNAPRKMRGKSVQVTFHVAADGRVTGFTVDPPIDDRDYAKKFAEIMRDYIFTPAKDPSGKAIAGVTTIEFTF